ncbi:MAG: choice-of-anchor T family protein [Candidatus Poseidoniaceae archaeon]|nr:choice-of-anchor T family protein [Candidatus Poseidoniaceae archaeon]
MKALRRSLFLLGLYLASMLIVATPAAAQASVPAVDLQCISPNPSGAVDVPVYPGATLTGFANCKVSNPNSYIERIQIQVTADGLVVAAPGTVTVGPNGESEFQTTVRADQRMTMSGRNLIVTATVVEANGVPPPNIAESQVQMIINILQFSRLQVEAVEPFLQLSPKTDHNFEFKVYNQGNWADKFKVGVTDESRDKLEEQGFQISIPLVAVEIEGMAAPMKVRVMVRTPKNQGWTDEYHTLEFNAESEFSCRYETTGCNSMSQMITIYVRGVYLPGFELIPSLAMLGFAAAVIARRNIDEEDEDGDGEWREAAPGI